MELITGHSGSLHISAADIAKINSAVYSNGNVVVGADISYDLDVSQKSLTIGNGVALFSGRMVVFGDDTISIPFPDTATTYKKIIIGIHFNRDTATQKEICQLSAESSGLQTTVSAAQNIIVGTYPSTINAATTNAFMPLWEIIISGEAQVSFTPKYTVLSGLDKLKTEHDSDKENLLKSIANISSSLSSEATTRSTKDATLEKKISAIDKSISELNSKIDDMKLTPLSIGSKDGYITVEAGSGEGYILLFRCEGQLTSVCIPSSSRYLQASGVGFTGAFIQLPSVVSGDSIIFPRINVYLTGGYLRIGSSGTKKFSKGLSWGLDNYDNISLSVIKAYLIKDGIIS